MDLFKLRIQWNSPTRPPQRPRQSPGPRWKMRRVQLPLGKRPGEYMANRWRVPLLPPIPLCNRPGLCFGQRRLQRAKGLTEFPGTQSFRAPPFHRECCGGSRLQVQPGLSPEPRQPVPQHGLLPSSPYLALRQPFKSLQTSLRRSQTVGKATERRRTWHP